MFAARHAQRSMGLHRIPVLAFAVLPLLVFSGGAEAQARATAKTAWSAQLDRYVLDVISKGQIPGIAIAAVRGDSAVIVKGYGVRESGRPARVDANTAFDVAGLTQSFTAAAVAILVDQHVVEWDAPALRYLGDLALPTDSLTRLATLRDLLSHRVGLEPANAAWRLTRLSTAELLARARFLRPVRSFRRTGLDSNLGFTIAGEAAAGAARTTFESLLRSRVIEPLRLSSTTWVYESATADENVAAPHATIGGQQVVISPELQRRAVAPAGGLRSSASDLARWMRFQLTGVLDGRRYLSDTSLREMQRLQVRTFVDPTTRAARLMADSISGYGIGWQVADYRGHRIVWLEGTSRGQQAYMALFPQEHLGIAVLVNTASVPGLHAALANRIADALLGYPSRDWAGDALVRRVQLDGARGATRAALVAMRSPEESRGPRAGFAGRYDHPLYGPVWIRPEGARFTLQMGDGEIADLEYHGAGAFYVAWRDPWLRENLTAHAAFMLDGDSVAAFATTMAWDVITADRDDGSLQREPFTARKAQSGGAPRAVASGRMDLTGSEAIVGRWNLRILAAPDVPGSWLEVKRSGFNALVGRYVGLIGGARPIGKIEWSQGMARFTIPTEWETPAGEMRFEFRPSGDSLVGIMLRPGGKMRAFVGRRAPTLLRPEPRAWTEPVSLFNGKDLSGWTTAPTARALPNFWTVRDGILVNTENEGANLMTVEKYQDFRFHAEYRLPARGTSGVFLRGRYWVNLGDPVDTIPFEGTPGGVAGFLVPGEDARRPVGEWQSIDITLVGRRISVVLNGKPVIVNQIIPGTTGSAIDTDEAAPGPIMLQGEETRVEFRNLTISVPRAP
jgi:CubicO group peptidase (beta-lactamase class C family)